MKTLRTVLVGLVCSVGALAAAAEEPSLTTLTVTAKRAHATAPVVQRVAPTAALEIAMLLPLDMPEAAIDQHMAPIAPATDSAVR